MKIIFYTILITILLLNNTVNAKQSNNINDLFIVDAYELLPKNNDDFYKIIKNYNSLTIPEKILMCDYIKKNSQEQIKILQENENSFKNIDKDKYVKLLNGHMAIILSRCLK